MTLFLTSCDILNANVESMIKKPDVNVLYAQITDKMTELETDSYTLVTAKRGKYQNSINFFDLDGDGVDEIIVFYRSAQAHPLTSNFVNIQIFKQIDSKLISYFDIIGKGANIDKMDIVDLNNDGIYELIIGFISPIINDHKTFSIFEFDFYEQTYEDLYYNNYTEWLIDYIDGDEKPDIVYVHYNTLKSTSYLQLITYNTKIEMIVPFSTTDTLEFSPEFLNMSVIKTQDEAYTAILLTCKRKVMLSTTEILLWNDETKILTNISRNDNYEVITTVENILDEFCSYNTLFPQDIDNDGVLEIPICRYLNEEVVLLVDIGNQYKTIYPYYWYNLESNKLVQKSLTYINENQSYVIFIDPLWDVENIHVYTDYHGDLLFYYIPQSYLSESDAQRELLFKIVKKTKKEQLLINMELLYENDTDKLYYYFVANNNIKNYKDHIPEVSWIDFKLKNVIKG